MRNEFCSCGLIAICFTVRLAVAYDNLPVSSICDLQTEVTQGKHQTVRVEGLYSAGGESQQLISSDCSGRSTAVEFALKSHRLWNKLVQESNSSHQVQVMFVGEFYGPPIPDPKLPPAISRHYHPGWDYNSMTKLVVHTIQKVTSVSGDHPK